MDTHVILKVKNLPGQLARIAQAIEECGATIGNVEVLLHGEIATTREFIVETTDEAHIARVLDAIRLIDEVEIVSAKEPVLERHRGGKIRMKSRVELKHMGDYRFIYTPGVTRVARAIQEKPGRAWQYTSMCNTVGIFTNGTRVLNLGDIGVLPSLPIMEGKAALYDLLAGISAVPILIDTRDPDKFIETVVLLSKSFGGFHLEDIRPPHCFIIEEALMARLGKPVMHDDQHGTAVTVLAAIISACKAVGVNPRGLRLGQIGVGAAGSAIARIAMQYRMREVLICEPNQVALRPVVERGAREATLEDLMKEADIVVATTGQAGLIKPEMVRKGQVIFALSNPDPEIAPDEALRAGAAFAADGRTINNALAYPGIFRGVLDTRCRTITPEMYVAAAETLALLAPSGELLPNPLDRTVHDAVAESVRKKAREYGLDDTIRMDPSAKYA
jgi:malate dehydrogenase (oxaloacetate-decarboxylating)